MRDVWIAVVSTVLLMVLLLRLPSPDTRVIQLSEHDNGGDVHLKTGQELIIHVNSQDGEPTVWMLIEADRHVLQWGEPEYREQTPLRLGGPVDVVWRFRAAGAGRSPVRLDLQSLPGVQPVKIDRTFSVLVDVE
jgi:predicted secreted protein